MVYCFKHISFVCNIINSFPNKIWMSCASRLNPGFMVKRASKPTGVLSWFDGGSVRRTHTLRRIKERPRFNLQEFFNLPWLSKDTEAVSPIEVGVVPHKIHSKEWWQFGGTTSQQVSAPAGVGPTTFLNCRPSIEWSGGRQLWNNTRVMLGPPVGASER